MAGDRIAKMRALHAQAVVALNDLNGRLDALKFVIGQWDAEIKEVDRDLGDADKGKHVNRANTEQQQRHVAIIADIAAASEDGWVHIDDVMGELQEQLGAAAPTKGNVKKSLEGPTSRKQIFWDGGSRYRIDDPG